MGFQVDVQSWVFSNLELSHFFCAFDGLLLGVVTKLSIQFD